MAEPAEQPLNRTERRRVATHNDLLDAVRDLMIEHVGPEFTVTDIADRADVAQGTFYNHFGDRDTAIDAAVKRDVLVHDRIMRSMDFPGMDAVDGLASLYGINVHRALFDDGWCRFALASYRMRRWPTLEDPGPSFTLIKQGIDEGSMKASDVAMGAQLTRHLLIGLAERLMMPEPVSFDDAFSRILAGCATILDFPNARIPDLVERVAPALAQARWQ
jgi:AcrR family transcriptional regulator